MSRKNINIRPEVKFDANSIAVFKMAAYDVPLFKEVQGKDWVYFGKRNEYPYYLIDLYNRSAKHNAIINGKSKYIFGKGFENIGEEIINSENETFNEITKKCIIDIELFSGFYLEIIWDNGGNNIAEIRHIDYSSIRSNKDNTAFFWSEKWAKPSSENPGTFIVNANPDDVKEYAPYDENNKRGSQLFFYKSYRPGLKTYSLPEYHGAIVYVDIDIQIADYWNNAIHNGFSASHIINFYNGVPTLKEQEKLEEQIGAKLTGARSKKYVLNFTDLKDKGSDVQKLEPEDLDRHLQILNETVQQEIFIGHNISNPMLFGIKTEGQLGGRTELIEANELFQNVYVTPKQQLIEKLMAIVAKAKGIKGELKIGKIEPIGLDLVNTTSAWGLLTDEEKRITIGKEPIIKDKKSVYIENLVASINSLSPLIANSVLKSMTTNEVRSLSGLPPIKDGDKIPSVTTASEVPADPNSKFSSEVDHRLFEVLKMKAKKRGGKILKSQPFELKNIKQSEDALIKFAKDLIKKDPAFIPIIPGRPLIDAVTGEPIAKLEVVYTYQWRDAVPAGERNTAAHPSRDFCIAMMELSNQGMTWTREDINSLSNDMTDPDVQDVWESRGGWMTVAGTDVHIPSCRHIWVQQVIIT